MDIRTLRQDEAMNAIIAANYNAAILASVGFGKGRVIVTLLLKLFKEGKIRSVLYLCDNQRLRDVDFPAELDKWGTPELKAIVTLECYQTAYKWKDRRFGVIIGDEFDFALTKEYVKAFLNIPSHYKILVSGTLAKAKQKIINKIVPIVYQYSTSDAEKEGVLNKSAYYQYNYKMTEAESKEYLKLTKAINIAMAAEKNITTIQYWQGKRKELLYNLESSRQNVRKIMKWLWEKDKNTRLVIFCARTAQADKVCRYSYHGGNVGLDNLNKLQSGEISGVSVVGKVKRGINLRCVNSFIFEALEGTSTTDFEQKNGRSKRLAVDMVANTICMVPWYQTEDADGNIVFKPTIVDQWLFKCTSNMKGIKFENLKL